MISIHALLAESDCGHQKQYGIFGISIHALLAESDMVLRAVSSSLVIFLSTLSLRRATAPPAAACGANINFYPRSPCGERLLPLFWHLLLQKISIHALLAESDALGAVTSPAVMRFLSTLSLRRATQPGNIVDAAVSISIHALLAESDVPSCGWCGVGMLFLSTLSLRRATCHHRAPPLAILFLSTLSLRRATFDFRRYFYFCQNFYPRSPCGERPWTNSYTLTTC